MSYFDVKVYGEYTEDGKETDANNWTVKYETGEYKYVANFTLHESYNYDINVSIVLEDGASGEPAQKSETTPIGSKFYTTA